MTTNKPTERPILFNAEMVRALLAGRKAQTRRIVKGEHLGCLNAGLGANNETCPYGAPGNLLWVREAYADIGVRLTYAADADDWAHCQVKRWTPSIHMPRWASRLTLEITGVRVERLQDISKADARAEGIERMVLGGENKWKNYTSGGFNQWETGSFRTLWELLNGYESWEANPWVWVIEFNVHHCNVDEFIMQREGQPS